MVDFRDNDDHFGLRSSQVIMSMNVLTPARKQLIRDSIREKVIERLRLDGAE
jgi:hypothetical protein